MPVDNERINRIKTAMSEVKLDALVSQLPENIVFLSGWWPLTGTSWVIFTADGNCHLIVPACEAQDARAGGIKNLYTYEWAHLKAMEPSQQIKLLLAGIARESDIDNGKFGLVDSFSAIAPPLNVSEPIIPTSQSIDMIKSALPKAQFIDATELIIQQRFRKTPDEIEKMRIVNQIAGFGLSAFQENIREGISEIELASLVNSAIMVKGSGYKGIRSVRGFAQVSSGKSTVGAWKPCLITTEKKLLAGDIVMLELGTVADGLWADNTRTYVVGQANDKQKIISDLILKAQLAAIKSIKVGVKMSDVDKAARDIITKAGFAEYFIHVTGHGIGWRYHEPSPFLHPENNDLLEEGMVTSVEPGIYIPDFGGFRLEDNVAVGKNGPDILTRDENKLI